MASVPSHHPVKDCADYMDRMNDLVENSKWQKQVMNGVDCRKALIPPPPSHDYMARMDYQVRLDKCIRFSDYFHKAQH